MFWHCWLVISLGNLAIKISCWQSPNISLRRILVTGLTHGNHRKKANLTRAQSISMWNVLIISCQPLTYWQCLVDSAWWRVDSDVSGTIQFHEPTGSLPLEFTPFRSLEDYWSKWVCTVCNLMSSVACMKQIHKYDNLSFKFLHDKSMIFYQCSAKFLQIDCWLLL